MGGEKSKEIGDYGEKIVGKLLNLIGWEAYLHPVEIPCHNASFHKTKQGAPKKDHGLDFLFRYKCPLVVDVQKTVSISAKYPNNYSTGKNNLGKYISELGNTIHCLMFDKDIGQFSISTEISRIEHVGLLFYITHDDDKNMNFLDTITQIRHTDKIEYKPIYVIDNKIATFLFSSVKDAQQYFSNKKIRFAYSNTEQNIGDIDGRLNGTILPIEFLTSGLLPVQVDNNEGKHLVLYSLEAFSEDSFESLFYFACKFTSGWAQSVTLKFYDYNERTHKNIISKVLSMKQEEQLTNKTKVENFSNLDFKDMEND